jgi:hypothetical protein
MQSDIEYAPEPSLDSNDAQYYVDLILMLAGLMHAPFEYFADTRLVVRSFAVPQFFVGSQQATNFLLDFIFTDTLVQGIETNLLFQKLNLQSIRLKELLGEYPYYRFQFAEEPYQLEADTPVFKLLGNTFCTSVILHFVQRIFLFQTQQTSVFINELDKQKNFWSDRFSGIIEVGVSRSPSATHTAYTSRASKLAGNDRWLGHSNVSAAEAANENAPRDSSWMVRWASVENRYDRQKLIGDARLFTDFQTKEFYDSGLLGFKEEELYRDDLSSFAMEGTSKLPRIYTDKGKYYWPQTYLHKDNRAKEGIVLIDKYYQEVISPLALGKEPIYGSEGLEPAVGDGGTLIPELLVKYKQMPSSRAKYWKIPAIEVETLNELKEVIDILEGITPDNRLLFRGQNNHYVLKRSQVVNEFLYGAPTVNELSLTTTASRQKFDFDHFMGRFQLDLQGLIYMDMEAETFSQTTKDHEGTIHFADPEIQRRYQKWRIAGLSWEITVMAIAQHYGIPTNGLDLTEDWKVAVWMALNESYRSVKDSKSSYWFKPIDRGRNKPVLYCISLINSESDIKIYEIPGLHSVRQEKQKAHLHFGGWGLHTNLCAEEVIAAVFLGPNVNSGFATDEMFPNADIDPLYFELLDIKERNFEAGSRWGYERIVDWTPEERHLI